MEKLRYSGRGPPGRGALAGRGSGRATGGRGGGGSWVRSRDSADESSGHGAPILRGPRDHGFKLDGPGTGSNDCKYWGTRRGRGWKSSQTKPTWRREHHPSIGNSMHANGEEGSNSLEMTKLGSNKLVLSTKTKIPSTGEMVGQQQKQDISADITNEPKNPKIVAKGPKSPDDAPARPQLGKDPPLPTTTNLVPPKIEKMIARGRNKLILSKSLTATEKTNWNDPVGGKPAITNKLASTKSHGDQKSYQDNGGIAWKRGKRPVSRENASTAKRVKIGGTDRTDAELGQGWAPMVQVEGKGKDISKNAMLTDFAYRETSRAGGGFSPGRAGNGNGRGSVRKPRGHHMGLVRVNPDESTTPICPTFLRGVPCKDERCTKRHDVPRESSMPVCSFFQRHGQCLKGANCPFRHVKVNPMALDCPSFSLLGYCDNDQCAMKHVINNKCAKKSNGHAGR